MIANKQQGGLVRGGLVREVLACVGLVCEVLAREIQECAELLEKDGACV